MFLILLILLTCTSCELESHSDNNNFVIKETDDIIISGVKQLVYQDSLLLLLDITCKEFYLLTRDGTIKAAYKMKGYYADSISKYGEPNRPDTKFHRLDEVRKTDPGMFENDRYERDLSNRFESVTFMDDKIVASGMISTFGGHIRKQNLKFIADMNALLVYEKNKSEAKKIRPMVYYRSKGKAGRMPGILYDKYNDRIIAQNFIFRLLDRDMDHSTIYPDSLNRLIAFTSELEMLDDFGRVPDEMIYQSYEYNLRPFIFQTQDSNIWYGTNFYPSLFNINTGKKIELQIPMARNLEFFNLIKEAEFRHDTAIGEIIKDNMHLCNYELLYTQCTNENEIIVDLLTAFNKNGKKEQYHLLQKYSIDGVLLGEKEFPQNGAKGNLQRIAYSNERDEFVFLIFENDSWHLYYASQEDVW